MTGSIVVDTLRSAMAGTDSPACWCVAFSGGLDSTVLLHALAGLRREFDPGQLRAVHVHHGLHANADAWTAQCAAVARDLGVPLDVRRITVDVAAGDGLEAAARRARYAAFESLLAAGETLLTAHHADDQLETVLLRLMRGSGVPGLGGIPAAAAFGRGRLLRPLLSLERGELMAYARARELTWCEDPSNVDTALDRNYLRHEVVPALRRRWPGLAASVGRAARLAAEAAVMLEQVARQDQDAVSVAGQIDLRRLRHLEPARQRNVVRYVLKQHGLVPPSERRLLGGLAQLLSARPDRQPLLDWRGGQLRRYRNRLYVLATDPERATAELPDQYAWNGRGPLDMGPVRGRLRVVSAEPGRSFAADLVVRFRRGGERVPMAESSHHKRLKKIFQATGVLPWMRAHVPLITCDGELLAVADLWSREPLVHPFRVVWDGHARVR